MKKIIFTSMILSICLVVAGCNLPGTSAPTSSELSTAAAQTVQAVLSPPVPASTTTATEVSAALASATPTSAAGCEDNATYTAWTRDDLLYDVKEVNKLIPPNKPFNMSWTLQNTGTCTWDTSYKMHFDDGTQVTAGEIFPVLPVGAQVPPGGTVKVDILMAAPDKAGDYESSFSLQDGNGKSVINFAVYTKVGNASSTSLASPGNLSYTYDCTSGSVQINLYWDDRASNEDGYRIYRDGAKLAELGPGTTSYSEIAPHSGKYTYSVAAYNGGGESPASVKVNTANCQ